MCCDNRKRVRKTGPAGFSLVEIMIVIVIIGLLASVVTVNVRSYLNRAMQNTARQEISAIVAALERYNMDYRSYPSNDVGLDALTRPGQDGEPLLNGSVTDPWGHPYNYFCPGPDGSPFEVVCYGADNREGGAGADADISSRTLKEKIANP